MRPYRSTVVVLAGGSFLGGAVEAVFLVVAARTALAITQGESSIELVGQHSQSVGATIFVAVGLLIVRLALALVGAWNSASLSSEVITSLRKQLADAYLGTSWAVQQAEPSGQLQNLANYANQSLTVVSSFTTTLSASLNLCALLLIAIAVDPLATIAVVAALAALASVLSPLRTRIRSRGRAAASAGAAYANTLAEVTTLGLEMQTYGVRDQFSAALSILSSDEASARRRTNLLAGALVPLYTTLAYGALIAGLAVAYLVGATRLSAVGAVMLVMLRSLAYGQQLQTASGNLMGSVAFLETIDATLERYIANPAPGGREASFEVAPIQAQDLSFSYPTGKIALSHFCFRIEKNEIIGVVGPSGSGKSTLVQLLLGLRDPTEGTIWVGGKDLRNIDRRAWSKRVSYVAQHAQLITGTAAANIRFFRDGLEDADVTTAASNANLLAELEGMPSGLSTHLGERAERLSGGQRQRLSIARALAAKPELIILDEPTSALDSSSENLIRQTLSELRGNATVVIIAHRVSTLEICDRIMVIEDGALTGFAAPSELLERNEFYRRACESAGPL